MPQPISRTFPNASIVFGNAGDRPLLRHPELGVLAMEAIASWSNVEGFMLRLFIKLLGGNDSLAASVFLALENQAAKSAAIKAAASTALRDRQEDLRVLNAIIAIAKTNEGERNKLAHWTWGDSPDIPDGLLLINPRSTLGDINRSDIYLYKQQDFQSIIQANDRLCGYGLLFNFILGGHVANRDGNLLRELMAEKEIMARLKPANIEE